MTDLLHAELTYLLRGIGFKIHNELGGSHLEEIYEDAIAWQLEADDIPFKRQPVYNVVYKRKQVGEYRPDFVLEEGKVALELKAVPEIISIHEAQGISYLAVTGAELALIMNFGGNAMEFKRLPNFLHNRKLLQREYSSPERILYPELTKTVLDGLFEIRHILGPGFLHQVYRRAALHELPLRGLAIEYIKELPIRYRGATLRTIPTRLIWIEQKVLLATVALQKVTSRESGRILWAMKELDCQLGIIVNFYPSKLDISFFRR